MTIVSVIIPTHNRRELLLEALDALRHQDYPRSSYEIVVAPDRCTDGTLDALEDASLGVVVAQPSRGGKAAALNAAIARARGDLAVFMDDDMLPDRQFLRAHVDAHSAEPGRKSAVTGYSPVALPPAPDRLLRSAACSFEEFHRGLAKPDHRAAPTDLNGANFSIGLEHIRAVGGFNESYFFQRDDFELGARLIKAGFTLLYCPAARAAQRITVTSDEVIGRAVPRAENDLRLAADYPWCVSHLPFHRALANPGSRLRWRILWNAGMSGCTALERVCLAWPRSARLVQLVYTARYIATLRRELRDWSALAELARVPG